MKTKHITLLVSISFIASLPFANADQSTNLSFSPEANSSSHSNAKVIKPKKNILKEDRGGRVIIGGKPKDKRFKRDSYAVFDTKKTTPLAR